MADEKLLIIDRNTKLAITSNKILVLHPDRHPYYVDEDGQVAKLEFREVEAGSIQ